MVGSEAIRRGVKQGVDEAMMTAMIRKLVEKIGADPGEIMARIEGLEQSMAEQASTIDALDTVTTSHAVRLERHRLRIRWLERWAHIHWPGWFSRPGL